MRLRKYYSFKHVRMEFYSLSVLYSDYKQIFKSNITFQIFKIVPFLKSWVVGKNHFFSQTVRFKLNIIRVTLRHLPSNILYIAIGTS